MKCKNCGIEFQTKRKDAKFCSPRCRVTFSRKQGVVTDNVTFSEPVVTDKFKFTIKTGPEDEERGLVDVKSKVREAEYWYDVPLAAVPVKQKAWPDMPDYMNGRQYFLWWKNNFKLQDDESKPGHGLPEIHNPFPMRDNVRYETGGEGSRRWGA